MKSNKLKAIVFSAIAILSLNCAVAQQRNPYNSPGYRWAVQRDANSGQNNVCVSTPTQYQASQSNGYQVGGGYSRAGANVNASYNRQNQNQGSYTVNQYQCGNGNVPQQGQQFYVDYGNGNHTQPVRYNNYYNTRRR